MDQQRILGDIVGSEHVSKEPAVIEAFSKDHSFARACEPGCVVCPGDTAQVQAIVEWANETRSPVIPVSSGPPHFRGDTVPVLGGVTVDLSRMNAIKMIDRPERVAMVEPGVRFGELQAALEKEGLRLPAPLSPRSTKSVLASCLEREPHIIPKYHLDHSEPLLCLEVVFGTGDVLRTGDAAGPGTIEEQWEAGRRQKQHLGVMTDEFRYIQGAQGSMGIVTWATVRCEVLPVLQEPFLAASDDLEPLLDLASKLVRLRLGDELFILNDHDLALLLGSPDDSVEALHADLPRWILFFCVAGYEHLPEERVDYQKRDAARVAEGIGIPLERAISGVSAREVLRRATHPSGEPYWKLNHGGGCQDIPFICSYHDLPGLVATMTDAVNASGGYPLSDLGVHIQPVCQGHGYHCELSLSYDRASPTDSARVKDLYVTASEALMSGGAFFSRPYDLLAPLVLNRDAATRDALKTLRAIHDPNNIMNPGRLVH
jgi:FAD/FMN-containing dehydrogenase